MTSYHHLYCEPNCHFWSANMWGNSLRSPQWLLRSFEKEAVIWRPPDVKMVWCVRRVLCHSSEETLFLVCFHLSQSSRSSSSFKRSQSILWQIVQTGDVSKYHLFLSHAINSFATSIRNQLWVSRFCILETFPVLELITQMPIARKYVMQGQRWKHWQLQLDVMKSNLKSKKGRRLFNFWWDKI